MRRFLTAGIIFCVLLFDCVLLLPFGFDHVLVPTGEITELWCSGENVLLEWKCQCQVSDIEQITLSRKMNDSSDTELLSGLTKTIVLGTDKMVPVIWNKFGWIFLFGPYEITAKYFQSTAEINGLYLCSVVVLQGSNITSMNTSVFMSVKERKTSNWQVQVINYAYEILAFLIALTVFSCMFVLIFFCTEDKRSVPEKRQKFYRWKEKKLQQRALSRSQSRAFRLAKL